MKIGPDVSLAKKGISVMTNRLWLPKLTRQVVSIGVLAAVSVVYLVLRATSLVPPPNVTLSGQAEAAGKWNGFDLSNSTIPQSEIFSGGPPRDGIPAILEPKFVRAEDAHYLKDEDVVLGIKTDDAVRAYPFRILVWHEIVNDRIGGKPVVVTYCPLCGTAMVFDGRLEGREHTFGVSGLLYNSDALMYDHQTESLWSQLKMEAISGPMAGTRLTWLAATQTTWGAWRAEHPETQVLSVETGHRRNYSGDAYRSYMTSDSTMFPVPTLRTELKQKDWVVGIIVDGVAKAYPLAAVETAPAIDDLVNKRTVRLRYEPDADHVSVVNAEGKEIPSVRVYWFAWQAFYPNTLLYDADR